MGNRENRDALSGNTSCPCFSFHFTCASLAFWSWPAPVKRLIFFFFLNNGDGCSWKTPVKKNKTGISLQP